MSGKRMTWEEAVIWLKGQPEQAELVRACFYDDPLIAAAKRFYSSSEWAAVREFLPKTPGKALDLGAGRGISSYALSKDGWNVTALEPDASPLVGAGAIRALAKEAGLDIKVEERRGERLPFKDETFDLVYCRQALHHAKDLKALCREAGRVLKKGGTFIATREHVISKPEDLNKFLESHPLHCLYGGEGAYLLKEYISAIKGAGIKLMRALNPYSSEINLFPETFEGLKARLAKGMKLPWPVLIPDLYLRYLGRRISEPGRLYSFIGKKNG